MTVIDTRTQVQPGQERVQSNRCLPQDTSETRHVHLKRFAGGRGRVVAPHEFDQPFGGDRLFGVDHQAGHHRSLASTPQRDLPVFVEYPQRPQHPDLHQSRVPALITAERRVYSCPKLGRLYPFARRTSGPIGVGTAVSHSDRFREACDFPSRS